jgi:hypothetical protein
MPTESEIVGYWYDENFGGHSADDLVFFPNGKGVCDYYNPGPAGREEFEWRLIEGGTRLLFVPALWAWDSVEVSTFWDAGRRNRVLRFEFYYHERPLDPRSPLVKGTQDYYLGKPHSEYKPPRSHEHGCPHLFDLDCNVIRANRLIQTGPLPAKRIV